MTSSKDDVLWTIKVEKSLDVAMQKAQAILGYKSKAELAREAIREFLIRRKLFALLGGEPTIPITPKMTPQEASDRLITLLGKIPRDILAQEIQDARTEVAKEFLEDEEHNE